MARTEARGSRLSKEFARSVQLGDVETGIYRKGESTQGAAKVDINVDKNKYKFSVVLGKIAEVGAAAVALPCNERFEVDYGAAEMAFFYGEGSTTRRRVGKEFLEAMSTLGESNKLPFGEGAVFAVSKKFGTDNLIVMNSVPKGDRLTSGESTEIVSHALEIADHLGVGSLAVPEIGRPLLNTSMTLQEILSPILKAYMQYMELAAKKGTGIKGTVKNLSVVSFGIPSAEGIVAAGESLSSVVNSAKESLRRGNY